MSYVGYLGSFDWCIGASNHDFESHRSTAFVDGFQTFGNLNSQVHHEGFGLFVVLESNAILRNGLESANYFSCFGTRAGNTDVDFGGHAFPGFVTRQRSVVNAPDGVPNFVPSLLPKKAS